jgi:hypothetical protein
MAGHDNVLLTISESGLIYSWGNLGNKRVTRSTNSCIPSLVVISERIDRSRKSVTVKFNRFIPNHEPTVIDDFNQTWIFRQGNFRKIKHENCDDMPEMVQFVGFK